MTIERKAPLIKMVGEPLPKRLLRPFFYIEPQSLDDKQYVILSGGDPKISLESYLIIVYVIAGGGAFFTLITGFSVPATIAVTLIALAIALTLHYYIPRMEYTRFIIFDREAGVVRIPHEKSSAEMTDTPWEEWGGRLWLMSTSAGTGRHTLSLIHFPSYKMRYIHSDSIGIDFLLGLWSFLVQYMDKTAPLPDVPELEQYPDRTNGLGSWEEWEKRYSNIHGPDPYHVWLDELEANPELDVYNAAVEKRRGW